MVYDCFPFFNELDILEIRLNELDRVVDKFVLVEAGHTFQNKPKAYIFEENKFRFEKFLHKIIHIKVDHFKTFNFLKLKLSTPWDRSNYQKNMVKMGLTHCNEDDTIIISDLDEIPKASDVAKYANVPGTKVFYQLLSNYYLNCVANQCPNEVHLEQNNGFVYWKGSVMINYKDFTNFKKIRSIRDKPENEIIPIKEGGWHFSFIGQIDHLVYKLESWEHAREKMYDHQTFTNKERIKQIISSGDDLFGREYKYEIVPLDARFPEFVLTNPDKFAHIIG